MTKKLRLGPDLLLDPHEFATEVSAAIGMRESGKSNVMALAAEQLARVGVQVIVLDYVGIWFSLRLAPDGRSPSGIDMPVLGGKHGDVALQPSAGAVVGESLAKSGSSAVLDVSSFRKADRCRFAADFGERLFEVKKDCPAPCWLVLEEAQRFCLSMDTEVLTEKGWKSYDQLAVGQRAVAFDLASGSYVYEPIEDVFSKDYDGDLIHWRTQSLDCLMTSDHRTVIRRFQHDPVRYQLYPWAICLADKVPVQFQVPGGGAPAGSGVELSEDMLRLMGWVITDGYFHQRGRNYIAIEQATTTVKRGVGIAEEMGRVITLLGAFSRHERQRENRYIAANGGVSVVAPTVRYLLGPKLSDALGEWLGKDLHRIPRRVLEGASPGQLEALFLGLLEGDGTAKPFGWTKFYPGKNEGLADDFQELATRLGVRTVKRFIPSIGQWHVSLSTHFRDHWMRGPWDRIQYKGKVFCITIPSGAFVARRNGTVFVTGNCPQKLPPGMEYLARMLGAFEEIAEVGRNFGLGMGLLTQRPQKVAKDVLNLADNVFGFRLNGVLERKAIAEWVQEKGAEGRADVADELPSLPRGTALFWSPKRRIYKRQQLDKKSTYDAGATPLKARASVQVVPLDLRALEESMAAVVQQAKENDPKALKAEVARLRRELAGVRPAPHSPGPPRVVEVPTVSLALAAAAGEVGARMFAARRLVDDFSAAWALLAQAGDKLGKAVADAQRDQRPLPAAAPPPAPPRSSSNGRANHRPQAAPASDGDRRLGRAARAQLAVLAQREGVGTTYAQLAVLSGYSLTSSSFANGLGELRSAGLAEGSRAGLRITRAGQDAVLAMGAPEPLPAGRALVQYWMSRLGRAERAFLEYVAAGGAAGVTKDQLSDGTGYSITSSSFANALGRLRTLELVSRGEPIRLSEALL